jgi:hypothetical protein
MQRILTFGNSGLGRTTLARALAAAHRRTHLDVERLVRDAPGERRPFTDCAALIRALVAGFTRRGLGMPGRRIGLVLAGVLLSAIAPDLLERLQRVSGLPLAPEVYTPALDSTTTILYLFRPLVVRPDSVHVPGGWMMRVWGDGGGAWGEEYEYLLDCRRRCRLLREPHFSIWN